MRPARSRSRIAAAIGIVMLIGGAGSDASFGASGSELDRVGDVASQRVVFREIPRERVIAAVLNERGVPTGPEELCPPNRLRMSFDDPGDGWQAGAYIGPLGPDTKDARTANGVIRCDGSHYGFVGFQATLVRGKWSIYLVPDPHTGLGHPDPDDIGERADHNVPDDAPIPSFAPGPIVGRYSGPEIEGYARYEGQAECDPDPKPGTLALRNVLLAHYPETTSFGVSRPCDVGGRSEHKEGRAFDWGADVDDASQRASVDDFLRVLFATDVHGNQNAIARRMGVMYVIWDGQIWNADSGIWQEYHGTSPHKDHLHISLSWAGGLAQTSFWSGEIVEGLPHTTTGIPHVHTPSSFSPSPSPSPKATPTPKPKATPKPTAKPTAKPSVAPAETPSDDGSESDGAHRPPRRTPDPTVTPATTP